MIGSEKTTRFRFWLWLIGIIVPSRLRIDWRQEWEAELRYREAMLADWDRLDWRNKLDLLWRSASAFWDALWLQQLRWEDEMIQDLRYAIRMLLKSPVFSAVAILSLALGIGANTAIFSLLDAILLKPLPVQQPDQLVTIAAGASGQNITISFSYPLFTEMRERNTVFTGMSGYDRFPASMSGAGQSERVLVEIVSGNFFSLLGVNPHIGRVFTEAADQTPGAHPVAVLSFNFWQRRFASDPHIIGQTINVNGYPFTVIGVSAQSFNGISVGVSPDLRIPIMMNTQVRPDSRPVFNNRGSMWMSVIARLRPGVSVQQAQADADTIFQIWRQPDIARIKGDTPDDRMFRSLHVQLESAKTGYSNLTRSYSQPLKVLMYMVGVVLLIACLNVANLLLARGVKRQKEVAIRLALGSGRLRLMRQLLTEGLLLSALGGALGLIFARIGTSVLLSFLPQGRIPTVLEVNLDLRILGFTLGVTLLTGLLFGLAPALQATRSDLIPAIKNETAVVSGRRRWELRRLLIILQVGLSLVLLVGAGLFTRSLRNLKTVDDGYHTDQVVTFAIDPAQSGYKIDRLRSFYAQLNDRVTTLPGVKAATYARIVPIGGGMSRIGIEVPGYNPAPGEEMAVLLNQTSTQYFTTFGIPLLMGRDFSQQDLPESQKVVIISDTFARRYFGTDSPLGKRISLENYKDLQIVGVVADAKYLSLKDDAPLTAYIPYSQASTTGQRILCVRTTGDAASLVAAIRQEVRTLDQNLPVFNVKTFADQINESVSRERLVALLSSFFGVFALMLASLGLYGVMSYTVSRRTREIGIRMALGADAGKVLWLVTRETLMLVIVGIAIGLPTALAATQMTRGLLFGLAPNDPLTITLATVVMITVAVLAGYLPARRAAHVDPMIALRQE